jgi:hypothetical protein
MFSATIDQPSPAALRAIAFALLSGSPAPSIPPEIRETSLEHRTAVRGALLSLADDIEAAPGPVAIVLTDEEGGWPMDVTRDALLLARAKLTS